MKRKQILVLLLAISLVITMVGCSAQGATTSKTDEKISITDSLGRTVEFESAPEKVVAVGVGALRLFTYVGDVEKIVGIEEIDQKSSQGKPYVIANPSFVSLTTIGAGGPNSTPDPEQILKVEPDVIFTTLATDTVAADELQNKTGIPVVALSSGSTGLFDETLYNSLSVIGQVMSNEERSAEVIEFIKGYEADLKKRTEGINDSTKQTSYVGALGSKGAQGIESTRAQYPPFVVVDAINVADQTGKPGSMMIDKEQLLQWNPAKIFIDYDGIEKVKADMTANPEYYTSLDAFKTNQVDMILPYILYGTNIEVAIADAYSIGKVLYPDQFKDVDPGKIMDEVSEELLGTKVYDQMVADYGAFGKFVQ